MTKDSDITPYSIFRSPRELISWKKIGKIIKRTGFSAGFFQLLLGIGSMFFFLLAVANRGRMISLGVNLSLFCAWCGLIFLIISIHTIFGYSRIAEKLTKTDILLSEKTSIVKKVKIAIFINLAGALVSFLGVEIVLGVMLSKVMALQPGILFYDCTRFPKLFVTSAHVFPILTTANLMAAHCAGLVYSLWALNKIQKVSH